MVIGLFNRGAKLILILLNTAMNTVFPSEPIHNLKTFLAEPHKIVITTHYKPDGDALGSSLGLAGILKQLGHTVTVVSPSEFPAFLSWMEGSNEVIDFLKNRDAAKKAFADAELVCCLDFNDPRRVESMESLLMESTPHRMLLDHHLDPKTFCTYNFSFPHTGSTCELVVDLIEALGLTAYLNRANGECLYAGIMTDTGSFRFNSVTPATHRTIALLMSKGARNDYVHEQIYDTSTEYRLKFLGHTLLNHMTVLNEFNTVYFTALKDDMETFHHESGDLEGIVNYGLGIKGIRMAVLFSERDKMIKISFRSKGSFSVKEFAEKHFEGGGHANAAGGRSLLSLDDTVKKFISLLPEYNDRLNAAE